MEPEDALAPEQKKGLFVQCTFALIRSAAFSEKDAESMAAELRLHDGEVVIDNYPDSNLDLQGITHIIATTYDFADYNACIDALLPVVKPTWVQHSLAKDKLANPRQYSPDPRYFMSDVVACVADLPSGDAEAIAGGLLAMGGLFSTKLTSQVTHIVTLTIESETCATAQRKKLGVKMVLPHWVDDCLRLGRKIDEQPYQLPNPEILNAPTGRAPIGKQKTAAVTGAAHPDPSQEDKQPSPPRKLEKAFRKKTVMLAEDLGISPYLRGILKDIITTGDGKITASVSKANMYVCKYREGRDYKVASRAGKDVGNLAWLYFLIQTDEWTSPLRRMLHYPVAKTGLAGFPGLKISLSNYSGEARAYLENLVNATGAECTKTLKQDNTHLITAHETSEKCSAARDWGVHIVNHLWLEESYAQWKMQSVTNSRYTHFPRRTNLGDVVGHTQLDRTVLARCFFPDDDGEMTGAPEKKPMRQVNQNTIETKQTPVTTRKQTAKASRSDPVEKLRTPASSRIAAAGKENITPPTSNSRKSKEVAASRLQVQAVDILLFNKESKRKGGVLYGGRRKSDEDRVETGRKRSVEEAMEEEDLSDDNQPKKIKRTTSSPTMHLVITGYKKWVNNARLEDQDKKQLRNLGILVTSDPSRASHLAAPQIVRTPKFVTALAYAPLVISTDFIDACLDENELLDPESFRLQNQDHEKTFGFSLAESRKRARQNRNQLLQGRFIYCMENIHGGYETFKTIVEANGGRCMLWRNRKGTTVPSGRADSEVSTDTEANHDVYLLTDDGEENKGLWQRFRDMAEASRKVPRIVTADWLLESAMSQQVRPTMDYEL